MGLIPVQLGKANAPCDEADDSNGDDLNVADWSDNLEVHAVPLAPGTPRNLLKSKE
jgi:hypothetical protein